MKENIESAKKYFDEVKIELKNVTWPSQSELINLTIVVLVLTIVLAVFVGIMDGIFVDLIVKILK
ncbi:preprotein translocase subunit SecE [Candidatus Poribacteria bacterium]|nr:preprotein translocase subunit SecE [Candidatus Poribacteria bacterium]